MHYGIFRYSEKYVVYPAKWIKTPKNLLWQFEPGSELKHPVYYPLPATLNVRWPFQTIRHFRPPSILIFIFGWISLGWSRISSRRHEVGSFCWERRILMKWLSFKSVIFQSNNRISTIATFHFSNVSQLLQTLRFTHIYVFSRCFDFQKTWMENYNV